MVLCLVWTSQTVLCVTFQDTSVRCNGTVFTIPDSADRQLVPNRYNVAVKFTGPDLAVIGDGTGRLFILDTNNRLNFTKWKV